MLDAGYWMLDAAGYWILDAGYWMLRILDAGCWMLDAGYWILETGNRQLVTRDQAAGSPLKERRHRISYNRPPTT